MADVATTVQLMNEQNNILTQRIQVLDQTLRTQQKDVYDLKTQYNEIWLAYAVQDGSSVIAPHPGRKHDVEEMLKTNLKLSFKFSQ